MSKKTLKKKAQAKAPAAKLGGAVADSARDIWLAGLGAFSVAQNEGMKLFEEGNKLFEKLVEEGAKLAKSTRGVAENAVSDLRGDVETRVGSVRKQAADNWDKLEAIFENRVARVLGRLGVPTAADVNQLSARVAKLSEKVSELNTKPAASKAAVRKASSKKATSKKATSKKAASGKAAS
jgi:poly(hydroxyalkanoate) granule-associated protein